MILLFINIFGIAYLWSDTGNLYPNNQKHILEQIGEKISITDENIVLTDSGVIPGDYWCILIDEGGRVIWDHNRPDDIPTYYTINDIAKLTRWFLNDYPVYVRAEDYGLLVMGMPKNAVGKI